MNRKPDLSFEALAEATSTDWNVGRGKLNEALSGIRSQMPGIDDAELATEILYRAKLYRRFMGQAILTPQALNMHWKRVLEENERTQAQATNQQAAPVHCTTCAGVRFVVYSRRRMPRTELTNTVAPTAGTEFISPTGGKAVDGYLDFIEEYAPCPECHAELDTAHRRADGSMFRGPDAAQVRERLSA